MSIPQKPLEKNQQYSINKKNIFKIFSSTNKVESYKKDIRQSQLFSIIKSEKNKFERTKKKIFFKSEKINTIIKNGKESPNANKKIKFNVTNNIDGNDLISYYGKNLIGKWKNDEHQRFIEGVKKYGNDWSLVQKYVRTRTIIQIRSHAQKFMKKLKKLKILETNNYDFSKSSLKIVHKIIKNLSNKKYNQILKLSKPLFNINEIS
jgi:SHAQKYF class myb-like DNA-binding protein